MAVAAPAAAPEVTGTVDQQVAAAVGAVPLGEGRVEASAVVRLAVALEAAGTARASPAEGSLAAAAAVEQVARWAAEY